MKKALICAAAFTLTVAVSMPGTCANSTKESGNFPRIVSLSEFPQGIKLQGATMVAKPSQIKV